MLQGYADENVDARVVAGLRRRGMDVVTAQERGQRNTDDEILLTTATAESRLLLTNDTDFLRIHARWISAAKNHAGIVFWTKRLRIGEAIRRNVLYASKTSSADAANMVKFL